MNAETNTRPTVEAQPQGEVGELVERLEARAERQREQRGDYFYKGQADPEIEQAARTLTTQSAEIAALRERVRELEAGVRTIEGWCCPVLCVNCKGNKAKARALLEPEAGK